MELIGIGYHHSFILSGILAYRRASLSRPRGINRRPGSADHRRTSYRLLLFLVGFLRGLLTNLGSRTVLLSQHRYRFGPRIFYS